MHDLIRYSVPQTQETNSQIQHFPNCSLRYAYARSTDTKKNDDIGQDYLALSLTDERLTFAVCDGVSQSFFGDLAARALGNALVQWLEALAAPLTDSGEGYETLQRNLQALIGPITEEVIKLQFPEDMPGLVAVVLEKKRQLGSESTFAAGTLDFKAGWYSLAWMGDTRLRIWDANGELTGKLGKTF